jgi:hypothetical protein
MWDRLYEAGLQGTTKWPADRFDDSKPALDSCFATLETSIKASMKVDAILNPATSPSILTEHADHCHTIRGGSSATENTGGDLTGASNATPFTTSVPSGNFQFFAHDFQGSPTGRRRVAGVKYKRRKSKKPVSGDGKQFRSLPV